MNYFVHQKQTALVPWATPIDAAQFANSTNDVAMYDDLQNLHDFNSVIAGEEVLPEVRSRGFNIFETIDCPNPEETATCNRPQYSTKHLSRKIEYDAPEGMKQYSWKPWKKAPGKLRRTHQQCARRNTETAKKPTNLQDMMRVDLVRAVQLEHLLVDLDVGTISVNLEEALGESRKVNIEDCDYLMSCLKEIVRNTSEIKRACQRLIGWFI
ncbi:hypothetical protein BGX27_008082 [Mortierella sp. AM989]|nr:hypothetical protein BGX27_008082 [Mortierella sp. AM989]